MKKDIYLIIHCCNSIKINKKDILLLEEEQTMYMVDATELKSSFKTYAGMVSRGEVVAIKRPKKEGNLVLIREEEYQTNQRILAYFMKLYQYRDLEHVKTCMDNMKYYSDEFIHAFGSLEMGDLERPEQPTLSEDSFREAL